MLEFIKDWVIHIAALSIFIVLLEVLVPSGQLKKFVNLVSGLVLVIAIINPLFGYLKKGVDLQVFQAAGSNFIDRKEIEKNAKNMEAVQMEQMVEVYRKKLIRQIEQTAKTVSGARTVRADVMINEDYQSEDFGEIKRIYVFLKDEEEIEGIKPVTKIERVEIGKGGRSEESETKQGVRPEIHEKLEEKIGGMFSVGTDDIVISALEE